MKTLKYLITTCAIHSLKNVRCHVSFSSHSTYHPDSELVSYSADAELCLSLAGFAQLQTWIRHTRLPVGSAYPLVIRDADPQRWLCGSPPLSSSQCRGWKWCFGGKSPPGPISSEVISTLRKVWAVVMKVEKGSWWFIALSSLRSAEGAFALWRNSATQVRCQAGLPTLLRSVSINRWWELMPVNLGLSPVREHCYDHPAYIFRIYRSSHCVALPISIQSESWRRTEGYYINDFIYSLIF